MTKKGLHTFQETNINRKYSRASKDLAGPGHPTASARHWAQGRKDIGLQLLCILQNGVRQHGPENHLQAVLNPIWSGQQINQSTHGHKRNISCAVVRVDGETSTEGPGRVIRYHLQYSQQTLKEQWTETNKERAESQYTVSESTIYDSRMILTSWKKRGQNWNTR